MKHICTKFVAMLLVIAMIAGVLPFAFAANVGPFTDVKDTDWFASNVQYVYDNGLMNGTTTTTFEPESNLTRAQTAMVLWRIAGQPAPTAKAPFTDLVDAWYRDAIAWAAEQKVVNGRGDGTFDPAGFITREELVTMIWRYAGEAASEQDLSNWPDADKVYDYAAGAMKWAVETGVINGKDGKLAPKDNATRAQFAAIIERYMKLNDTKADDIVILYTNDVHANITGGSSKAPTLTYEQVAWYRNNLQTPYSLLVDAGDAIQGEAISTLTHGEAIVEVMNAAGYDYATFGNHEFDYGMDQLLDTIVPAAKYQYLTCNFARLDGTAIDGVKPYAIETFGSKKVAVIGISTPESFVKSTPTYFQDKDGNYIYTFAEGNNGQDLYDSVQKTIDAAKKDGADYVVAVAHLGIDESSEPWRSTDVIANTTGLDAVLDGHSHSTIPQEIVKSKDGKDVILSSTGTKLNNLGKLTISADGKLHSELISDLEIEKDAKTKEVVDKIVAEFQALLNKVVAHTDVDLTTQNPEGTARAIRNRETNLGDLCADAYRVTLGADIAIVNGGGIRADIPAGDITYNQIIKVHPYGNMACVVEATGQEILDALEMASRNTMADYVSESVDEHGNKVYNAVGEMGGFLQVSGMKYTINTAVESTVKTDDKGSFVSVEGARRVQNVQVLNQTTNTYEPIDPARVSLGTLGVAAGAFLSDEVSVTVSSAGIEKGYYLIPIVVELPAEDIYTSKEPLVRYLLLTVSAMEIDVDATALTGVKIEPASGWTIVCYQGTASSGANGVWNLDSDAQKACMFDGKLDSNCWYAANASYSWGNGGNFIITLDKAYDINGFRWHIYYEDSNPECTDFQYSEDGTNWYSLTNEISFVPKLSADNWKIFQFKKTVKARYLRVYVGRVTDFTSMNEAEIFAPAN